MKTRLVLLLSISVLLGALLWLAPWSVRDKSFLEDTSPSPGQQAGQVPPAAIVPAAACRRWTFQRDNAGHLMTCRDPAGREAHYAYYPDGKVKNVSYSHGPAVSYSYSDLGLRASMTDSWGTSRYAYTPLGFLESVSFPGGHMVKCRFDPRGLLCRLELEDGWWIAYEYDPLDRPLSVESKLGKVEYSYRPDRRVEGRPQPQVARRLPNAVITTWTFDADGRLIDLRHERNGSLLAGWSYDQDGRGRIRTIHDLRTAIVRDCVYDSLGQLRQVVLHGNPEESYEYDVGSNLKTARRHGESLAFHCNPLAELVVVGSEQLDYNRAGELTGCSGPVGNRKCRWDAAGRLVGVSTSGDDVQLAYDGDGNLVRRQKGAKAENFVYHLGAATPQLLAVYDDRQHPVAHHLLGPSRLAVQDASGQVLWFLEDHLQSVRQVIDGAGKEIEAADYSAFGHTLRPLSASGGFGFTGEWRDPDTGLIYLRARWYDPRVGRFISPDPVWGNLGRPVSLNRYAYVQNDPVNLVDPTGLYPLPPPPPPSPFFDDLRWLFRQDLALRGFSGAVPPLPLRGPDFYVGGISTGLDLPGGVSLGGNTGIALDRHGHLLEGVSVGASASLGIEPPVQVGALWILQRDPPTAQQIRDVLHAPSLTFHVGLLEYMRSGGKNVVGIEGPPGMSVSSSWTPAGDDLRPNLLKLLERLRPNSSSRTQYPLGLSASDLAAALADNPYKVPRRDMTEAKLADYRDRLARANPLDREKVFVDWVEDAHYSSPDQVRWNIVREKGLLGPVPKSLGDGSESSGSLAPRVGGVYLDGVAELLGQMGSVQGAFYDRDSGRLVLISNGSKVKTTHLRGDDLAVAVRAVAQGRFPGFSIDPVPSDPRGPVMNCRYIGPIERTHFGLVMFLSDRLLKDIGSGQTADEKELRPRARGFKDQFELAFQHGSQSKLWNRFWLTPGKVRWQVSPDGKVLWCKQAPIVVKTETMLLEEGKLVPAKGRTDPAAEAYARFFSENYDELAREYPEFEDLRQLAQVVGLVAWLKRQLPAAEFDALASALIPGEVETPVTTPAVTRTRSRQVGRNRVQQLSIYGGVDLAVRVPEDVPQAPELEALATAVRKALPGGVGPSLATIETGDRAYRALALPLQAFRPVGSLTLHATDILAPLAGGDVLALTRHYNSTRPEIGVFGLGWDLLVPELRLHGHGTKVSAYLTDAWLTFHRDVQTPDFQEVRSTEEGHLLVTANGSVLEFGRHGKLTRCRATDLEWCYTYEGVRLRKVTVAKKGEVLGSLALNYNTSGLVATASDHTGAEVHYEYDPQRRLYKVHSGPRAVVYEYGTRLQLLSVRDGKQTRSFTYTPAGYLLCEKNGEDRSVRYQRELTAEGGAKVRLSGDVQREVVFDAEGRVVRVEQDRVVLRKNYQGATTNGELLLDGQFSLRIASTSGRQVKIEYAGGRRETYVLHPTGAFASGTIEAGGQRVQVVYREDGVPNRVSDAAGGEYRILRQGKDECSLVTPAGSYRITRDGDKPRLSIIGPSGKQWQWDYGDSGIPTRMVEKDAAGGRVWAHGSEPRTWECKEGDRLITRLRMNEAGRIAEFLDISSGMRVFARHGIAETVVQPPDGRQLIFRRASGEHLVEVLEQPAGAAPAILP